MKVAFLTSTFPKLSETFIVNQITGLIDAGHQVDIYAHSPEQVDLQHPIISEYNLAERTTYTHPPESYLGGVKRVLSAFGHHPGRAPEVVDSLRRGFSGRNRICFLDTVPSGYDLYHAHFGWVGENTDFIPSLHDAPYVVSFYGNDAGAFLQEDPTRYDNLWPRADVISVLSYDMKEKLVNAGAPQEKIRINPLSINLPNFDYSPTPKSSPLKIATIARFTEKKGLRYAIEGISKLPDKLEVEYKIAGEGNQREELEALIKSERLEDTVELLGWLDQSEIDDLLEESHLFLLPSHTASDGDREGTPTALLEAQASGLPIISTYHAGIPEIVQEQERGRLCPVMDSDSIANAILDLWRRSDEWEEMTQRGREYVAEVHSREAQTDRLENIYREVTSRTG